MTSAADLRHRTDCIRLPSISRFTSSRPLRSLECAGVGLAAGEMGETRGHGAHADHDEASGHADYDFEQAARRRRRAREIPVRVRPCKPSVMQL